MSKRQQTKDEMLGAAGPETEAVKLKEENQVIEVFDVTETGGIAWSWSTGRGEDE